MQIATANEGDSRFSISLSCDSQGGDEVVVHFLITFARDVTVGARFKSAVFEVNFYQYNDAGDSSALCIRDFEPKDQTGETIEVGTVIDAWDSLISLPIPSTIEQHTAPPLSRIRAASMHPSTVRWSFEEDEGRAGLERSYEALARIPNRGITSITFWAKAILAHAGPRDVALKMGSKESPYEKFLDLQDL